MKPLRIIAALILMVGETFGQSLANEWIDYSPNKTYLRIEVTQTGLHRIDENTLSFALQQAGESLSNIDPRTLQAFGRGEEVPIKVFGESDGVFNSNDEIVFFAEKNDGWADASMYVSEDEHTNPYYSLYNDTAAYFLTWDPNGVNNGLRFTEVPFTTAPTR